MSETRPFNPCSIRRRRRGDYELVTANETKLFDTLNELMEEVEREDLTVQGGAAFEIGYRLGGIAVALSETPEIDHDEIVEALLDSTDGAWRIAVANLGALIVRAAHQMGAQS